jgi:hypothetical protein
MILTRDYRQIWASFDQSVAFTKTMDVISDNWTFVIYEFWIGPLKYEVSFSGAEGNFSVMFETTDVKGTDEELLEYFSKMSRRNIRLVDIPQIRYEITYHSTSDLGVGNAPAVFATVVDTVKDMVDSHDVKCLVFSATSDKKASVYSRLVKVFSGEWVLKNQQYKSFKLCRT